MSETQAMTKDEIGTQIALKAFTDENFRKRVLANANEVYEQETGQKLPPGVSIKVYEDTPTLVNFTIPAKPNNVGELSDSELEQVAGGTSPTVAAATLVTLAVTLATASAAGVSAKAGHKW